jgi:membrane protease YdiL (CAAX protease family)
MGTPLNAFFISIHAGISEESVFRLFYTTLLVWLTRKCYSTIHDDRFAVWIGILLAGILFGAAHLPAISVLGLALTVPLAAKIIMFNATCGIFFGYMYWRYSLVTAMLTHIIVDIAIYTAILPLYLWLF